jgi:hypothetical protein
MDTALEHRTKATIAIIEAFGGLTEMARELGHTNPTTVQGWKERGIIPARPQLLILEAANRLGLGIEPQDFFRSRKQAA